MSAYPPSRTAGLLPMNPLQDGESSAVYRVRGPLELHAWLGSMTAQERGALLVGVMHGSNARQDEPAAQGVSVPDTRPLRLRQLLTGGSWSVPQRDLVNALAAGGVLTADQGGGYALTPRTGPRVTVSTNTVSSLIRKGVLE